MGKRHIVAIGAVILVGFAVKVFVFAPTADAEVRAVGSSSLDVSRLHEGKNLPVQKLGDMSFIFTDSD
jgi:hypothetical protein